LESWRNAKVKASTGYRSGRVRMDHIFIIKAVTSFFIAGIWITSVTLLAEKFGSKIGGLITNLPSNILISFLFIALTKNVNYVKDATVTVPIGMSIDALFLLIFIILLRYKLTLAVIISLSAWFLLAIVSISIPVNNIVTNIIVYIIITVISFILVEKVLKIKSVPKNSKKYSLPQILIRAAFAGSVVSGIVIIAYFLNPFFVGIISTFPAVLSTTMIILAVNQNNRFAQATGKILILSSTNIVIYSSAVYVTYPVFGIIFGTIISFALSFIFICTFIPIIRRVA